MLGERTRCPQKRTPSINCYISMDTPSMFLWVLTWGCGVSHLRYLNTSGFWSRLQGALLGFSCAEKCSDLELETCLTAVYSVQLSWDPSLVCFNMYSIRASAIHSVGSDAVNMQLFCSRLDMFGISATQTTYVAGSISCPLTIWTYFQSEIYPPQKKYPIKNHSPNLSSLLTDFPKPRSSAFFSPESTEKNRPTS